MIKKRDKKGAALSLEMLVVIIVLVVLVAFIILYLTGGFNAFGAMFENLFGRGKTTVTAVATGCETACMTGNQYAWCSQIRDLRYKDEEGKIKLETTTCHELGLEDKDFLGMIEEEREGLRKITCPGISCS